MYCRVKKGLSLCLSGVKNADESELRQVASEPLEINVYNVNDFPLLSKLVDRLVHILCGKIEERSIAKSEFMQTLAKLSFCEKIPSRVSSFSVYCVGNERPTEDPMLYYPSPTDLEFSELGPREVLLSWTGPARPVLQYRVVLDSAEGKSTLSFAQWLL